MTRYFAIGGVLIGAALGGYALSHFVAPKADFKAADNFLCPDDYATAEEATAGMVAWENNFFNQHPGADTTDMVNGRLDFYHQHNCIAALQRYEQAKSGTADKSTMDRIDSVLQQYKNQ